MLTVWDALRSEYGQRASETFETPLARAFLEVTAIRTRKGDDTSGPSLEESDMLGRMDKALAGLKRATARRRPAPGRQR
ncbi:MAG: hypothetical protein WC485_09135 [Opitutaceae bacterium]